MKYFLVVYGTTDDILSVSAHIYGTIEEMQIQVKKAPSNIPVGTQVMSTELSEEAYKKLNEIFDFVEENQTLKTRFLDCMKGIIRAILDNTATKDGVEYGLENTYVILKTFLKYELPTIYTKHELSSMLIKLKADKNKSKGIEKKIIDILINGYTKKIEILNVAPDRTMLWT